jgi:hypothetical protein
MVAAPPVIVIIDRQVIFHPDLVDTPGQADEIIE